MSTRSKMTKKAVYLSLSDSFKDLIWNLGLKYSTLRLFVFILYNNSICSPAYFDSDHVCFLNISFVFCMATTFYFNATFHIHQRIHIFFSFHLIAIALSVLYTFKHSWTEYAHKSLDHFILFSLIYTWHLSLQIISYAF